MAIPTNIEQLERIKFTPDASGNVAVRTVLSGGNATIYAIVNTGSVGVTGSLATLLAGPNQIGSVTVSNAVGLDTGSKWIGLTTTAIGSAPTLYAVVNTSAPGTQNSLATLLAGPNQIGSVTVSNPIQLATGTNWIGLTTTTIGSAPTFYAVVNTGAVGNQNSLATLLAGPNQIGSVTVSNPVQLAAGTNWVGLATTVVASAATLYAVVNTAAAGVGNSLATILNFPATYPVTQSGTWDEVGINDSGNTITVDGTVTVGSITSGDNNIGNVDIVTLPALVASSAYIGLATVIQANQPALIAGTAYVGLASVNIGGTLPALAVGTSYIGLVTNTLNRGPLLGTGDTSALFVSTASGSFLNTGIRDTTGHVANIETTGALDVLAVTGSSYIGLASVNIGGTLPALAAGTAFIGLVTAVNSNQPALVAGTAYIGLASVNVGGTLPALTTGTAYIGLASVNIGGSLPALSSGGNYIGLVTAWSRNAGTAKILASLPITLSTGSQATIVVATGGSAIFYITNLLISSNATVRMNIKSGATYLTGNASLGINLNPGGGWVENGAPDSPLYLGLASGSALVIEKADSSGNVAQIGGKITYFQE